MAVSALLWLYTSQFDGGYSSEQAEWGAFGDYIGGLLNPLVATIALIGLGITIQLQSKTLRQTKSELDAFKEQARLKTEAEKEERIRLITKEYIDEYFSTDFLYVRNAVYSMKERIIRREVSVYFIAAGFIYPIGANKQYYVGDDVGGHSQHSLLTNYLGYITRLGRSIKSNDIDIKYLRDSLRYSINWDADFLWAMARVCYKTAVKNGSPIPDSVFPTFIVLRVLKLNSKSLHQIVKENDYSPTYEEQINSSLATGAVLTKQERREMTLSLHSQWRGELRQVRLFAWQIIVNKYPDILSDSGPKEKIKINQLRKDIGEENYNKIATVLQFFSDLKKLLDEGYVDTELSFRLFHHSVGPWFRFTHFIEYDLPDTTSNYSEGVKDWYENIVKMLPYSLYKDNESELPDFVKTKIPKG
ncbi:hypothetical protein R50073_50890 (plasmid) [Maricurvus nonylphenolicus]|uniref:hypothetical protein n=1 Tax=Maricurvus nonylphenolicus TaxID=1008307 RepID=UPI0036F3BE59